MDVQRAIFLAAVCSQTYAQFADPDGSFTVPKNYSVRHVIRGKNLEYVREPFGFILESPQEIILAFRGTSSAVNWISDLIATQIRFKYVKEKCLTHQGFTDIYASCRRGILSALAEMPKDKALFVTGHSLGAALATLCAVDLAAGNSRTPWLYTFGSPRVGDPAFAKAAAAYVPGSFRVANPLDAVTHVPPSVWKLPKRDKRYYYSHVKTLSTQPFAHGAIGRNHIIGSYFSELAERDPEYARSLCSANPGFCPVKEAYRFDGRNELFYHGVNGS